MVGGSPGPRSIFLAPPSQRYFVGLNRAQLRGWVWLGAVAVAILAYFAWPDLLWVAILSVATGAMVLLGFIAQRIFSETGSSSGGPDDEPRDLDTGARD